MLTGKNSGSDRHSILKSDLSNEVRVTAEELAASFPESTKFDRTPSSLHYLDEEKSYTDNHSDTAFYPIDDTATLEPITDSHQENAEKAKEENQINKHISDLAKKKLRAEAPFIKVQKLEDYAKQLEAALSQRDLQIENMNQSIRNTQRAYAQRKYEHERNNNRRNKELKSKNRIILGLSLACLFTFASVPFFAVNSDSAEDTTYNSAPQVAQESIQKQKYIYTVQPNDTLHGIAQKVYGDTEYYKDIMTMNNLPNEKPKPGTRLILSELDH